MESYIVIITTCASKEEAEELMQKLLKARLIACANIIPGVQSWFLWNGEITKENEVVVLMKSRKKYYPEIEEWIKTHHSYEVPEIIALPIVSASQDYLEWLHEETSLADLEE